MPRRTCITATTPTSRRGSAVTAWELQGLFPQAVAYDDAELTRALAERRVPDPQPWSALGGVEAFSLAEGPPGRVGTAVDGLAMPPAEAALVRNPLYGGDGRIAWPSERYRDEYGPRATYPLRSDAPLRAGLVPATEAMARRRELVDLPERW